MAKIVKLAAVQTNPRLMEPRENLENIISATKQAANNQAELIIFPECCLSGYIFHSREEALPFAETIPGPSTERLISACKELQVYIILAF